MSCEMGDLLKEEVERTVKAEALYPPPGIRHEVEQEQRLAADSANARVAYLDHRKTCSACRQG
jgi:hypothetical protein